MSYLLLVRTILLECPHSRVLQQQLNLHVIYFNDLK